MAPKKKISGMIKLQIQAGQANPAPPVGPALGQHGVNIMDFCKAYNAATENQRGQVIPVEITVYEDRSFDQSDTCLQSTRLCLKCTLALAPFPPTKQHQVQSMCHCRWKYNAR